MNSKTFDFQYDHAMALFKYLNIIILFTDKMFSIYFLRKDLWKDGTDSPSVRTNVAGFAYLKGVCNNIRYSVSEDQGGFSSIYVKFILIFL